MDNEKFKNKVMGYKGKYPEFEILGYFFSIKPIEDCLFSRRNGYRGVNFLGHNLMVTKIW